MLRDPSKNKYAFSHSGVVDFWGEPSTKFKSTYYIMVQVVIQKIGNEKMARILINIFNFHWPASR